MQGRLTYEENRKYLIECECGKTKHIVADSWDDAENYFKDLGWKITNSDTVKTPYALCKWCAEAMT